MNVKLQIYLIFFTLLALFAPHAVAGSDTHLNSDARVRHTPIARQERLVPIPVYVEAHPSLQVDTAILYYRTPGEKIYQQVKMSPYGKGFAATIGCDVLQVIDPRTIAYYIALKDKNNRLRDTIGTEAKPYQIVIGDGKEREPLSLPGTAPPARCKEDCPPWNPDCGQECRLQDASCNADEECCEEMTCQGGRCLLNNADKEKKAWSKKTFRLAVVFGTGGGIVNSVALHPYNQVSITPDHINNPPPESGLLPPDTPAHEGRIGIPTTLAWSTFHFRLNPMFYLTDLFLVGLSFRGGVTFESDNLHADNTLAVAPAILAAMAVRIVGEEQDRFELDVQFGLGGGLVYHNIRYTDCRKNSWTDPYDWTDPNRPVWYNSSEPPPQYGCSDESLTENGEWDSENQLDGVDKSFYLKSGNFIAEVGFDSHIWIIDNFGINIGFMITSYLGDHFALNFDIQVGPTIRF